MNCMSNIVIHIPDTSVPSEFFDGSIGGSQERRGVAPKVR